MPSSRTSLSRCRSSTSLGLVALLGLACSDDSGARCGPDGAPASGVVVTGTDLAVTYGNLSSLAGNDCPDPAAPAGVVSLSIEGQATTGSGLITLCIPRPDLLGTGDRALGNTTSMADVRVIDLQATAGACSYRARSTLPAPTGTVTATGVCANGTDPAGFALSIDGSVMLERTCGAAIDAVVVTITGRVAVTSRD